MVRLDGHIWDNGVVPTLRAEAKRGDAEPHVLILDVTRVDDVCVYEDGISHCLMRRMGTGGNQMPIVAKGEQMQVRRLTPIECERLMGWPDDHTATGTAGPVSDTNRYKMCGNGVASPVAEWIGQHLMAIPMLNKVRPDAE
jgi:site-specific DNA-cytosine methylase